MDLSIFSNGLTTEAYQEATKKSPTKTRTNNDWLKSNKAKLNKMKVSKTDILNNVVRRNQSSLGDRNIFFRLLGLQNKTLTLSIDGNDMNVIPCDSYQSAIQAYETSLKLYQDDAKFQEGINTQLEGQGAVIEAIKEVSDG